MSLEAWRDGFVFSSGGRILRHSSRRPALYVGRPRVSGDRARETMSWKGLGACSATKKGEGHFLLRFALPWELEVQDSGGIVLLRFRASGAAPSPQEPGLRLRFGAPGWSHVHGLGPNPLFDSAGRKVAVDPESAAAVSPRLPVAFGRDGSWLCLKGGGRAVLEFSRGSTDLSSSRLPEELALGDFSGPAPAMASLTAYRGLRAEGRPRAVDRSAGPDPAALLRVVLSYSFSGEAMPYLPIEGRRDGSKAEAARMRFALETAAFGPAFSAPDFGAGSKPAEAALFRRSAAVFEFLSPYRQRCIEDWKDEGIPLWSHPGLRYPEDHGLWDLDDQFLFGPDLLVAPSLQAEAGPRRLRLPEVTWVHLWTSRRYPGGPAVVDAPLGLPAVFYRFGSPFSGLFDELRKAATRL